MLEKTFCIKKKSSIFENSKKESQHKCWLGKLADLPISQLCHWHKGESDWLLYFIKFIHSKDSFSLYSFSCSFKEDRINIQT